jgi:uncharacterized protein (DUF488 family)
MLDTMPTRPFFTIGHSTRPISQFIDLLMSSEIELVADVRRIPRSRAHSQYEAATLAGELAASEIDYEHIVELGGLRGMNSDVPQDVNAFWDNRRFHNYADYALSREFRSGLAKLLRLGRHRNCAIMCAEAVWWRCHRRIIADYLIAAGEKVFHILGANNVRPADVTPGAMCRHGKR